MQKKYDISKLKDAVWQRLKNVLDPELNIDIVSLGLIYDVSVSTSQTKDGLKPMIHILLTLTTPGCPLASSFDPMIKDAIFGLEGIDDLEEQCQVELTFDPPWTMEMMSEEARAYLDFM